MEYKTDPIIENGIQVLPAGKLTYDSENNTWTWSAEFSLFKIPHIPQEGEEKVVLRYKAE